MQCNKEVDNYLKIIFNSKHNVTSGVQGLIIIERGGNFLTCWG